MHDSLPLERAAKLAWGGLSLTVALFAGCASGPAPQATPEVRSVPPPPVVRTVKSRDGKYTGEIIGTLAPGSSFARLEIGMASADIEKVMGRAPDRTGSVESGKRWIPFYVGSDARRLVAVYRGEGCLVLTGGNIWGGGGGNLIQIVVDPSAACF